MRKFVKSLNIYYVLIFIISILVFTYINPFSTTNYVYSDDENIVSYALSWVGNPNIPYEWGGGRDSGTTLESLAQSSGTGTDCSGFVSLVYKHFGVTIPSQSDSIHESPNGRKFYSIDDALPGDICWWDGHVALYIGQGKIVHTNTSDTTNNANLIHVSIIDGSGSNYRFPSEFIRFVDDSELLGNNGSSGVFGNISNASTNNMVVNAVATGSLVTESDLTGMKTEWSLEEYQKTINLMSKDDLPLKDQFSISNIKEGMKNSKNGLFYVNTVIQIIGYILMIYGLALVLAYLFDNVNNFIEISLLQLITFGHLHLVSSDEDIAREKKKKYVTKKGLIIRAVIVEILAITLISGRFTQVLLWIYNKLFL